MEQSILELIMQYKSLHKEEDFIKILSRFNPLIRKYAKQLYYLEIEDCIQELSLAIYEALQNVENTDNEYACISYIKKAVYHRFCKLYTTSEKEQRKLEKQAPFEDLMLSSNDTSMRDKLFLLDLNKIINSMQHPKKEILQLLINGYTDKDISERLHCSRQYVNRIKKTILNESGLLRNHASN